MTWFFQAVQGFTGNPVVDQLMFLVAELTVILVPVALVYLWYQGEDGRKTSLYAFMAVAAGLAASYLVLGQIMQHPSPYQEFETIASGEPENSFPSQHTAAVLGMILPLLWRKRRKLAYLFTGAGAATGFARIYIGEHYLIDILGSAAAAAIGFGVTYLVYRYMDEYVKELAGVGDRLEKKLLGPVRSALPER